MKKELPPPTLSDIGVTKDQSARWQSLAGMSDEHFETAVATAKDTAGQVTTAFMLREANKGGSHDETARAKRKPGRPLKRSPEYFYELLDTHQQLEAWFAQTHDRPHSSDRQLYTEYFAHHFLAAGERAGRATAPDFQRALKTLRNELAEARRLCRPIPEIQSLPGRDDALNVQRRLPKPKENRDDDN